MSYLNSLKANNYTNSVQKILKFNGDKNITKMTVYRTPLSSILKFLLSITSRGEFDRKLKELPYDDLYHLFLVIQLKDGGKMLLEKNEVIYLKKSTSIPKKTESLEIQLDLSAPISLNELLNKTKDIMRDKYHLYNSSNNNCQIFLYNILKANSLGNSANTDFVVQKTQSLFENDPQFRKIVNSLTDLGAVATNLKQNIDIFSPYIGLLGDNSGRYNTIGNALLNHDYTGYTLSPFSTMW